jgi:hypothetical protein
MTKKSTRLRCRNVMYVQQLEHLPEGKTPEDIVDTVANKLDSAPDKYAAIIHDKDTSDSGKHTADHLNIMMHFKNAVSINHLAKQIGDKPEYFQVWNNGANNGFAYLIHATTGARTKHQYDVSEVKANFDYAGLIRDIGEKVARSGSKRSSGIKDRIDNMLDLLALGELSYKNAINSLSGSEYATYHKKFEDVHILYLTRCAEKTAKKMQDEGRSVKVYWLYGKTATGKTRLAVEAAKDSGLPFYRTTAQKDPFEFYEAEPIVILDELRPSIIPYGELLSLIMPHSDGNIAMSSRYHNKKLSCEEIWITTPFDPVSFFNRYDTDKCDGGEQLYRRLTEVYELTQDNINLMTYDAAGNRYITVTSKHNIYSNKAANNQSLFKEVVDDRFRKIKSK